MADDTIFRAALSKPDEAARAAYLDEACAGRPELRAALEARLRLHRASGEASPFLSSLSGATGVDGPLPQNAESVGQGVSDWFGPSGAGRGAGPMSGLLPAVMPDEVVADKYRILEQLGQGGMGAVYKAEQSRPVRREVALKVMQPGGETARMLARFEAERQALAMMDHPNIAKVFDAGVILRNGAPFFVMELVPGVPLTDYCDQRRLTPRQRVELFVQICNAVQHAHQKGVIHRDLKPGNILVAEYDGRPSPKIIDFGIAKAKGPTLTAKTLETLAGSVVGTPEYMSPEQADPEEQDIDTRSDIYALGVILYELLTGAPPFDRRTLAKAGLWELLRVIREEEPPRPSTKLSTTGTPPSVAANRGVDPTQLRRQVRGDLDWIVMKALAKERERRYGSANAFAEDLLRFLADEPVSAGPPSRSYRLRKFVRRNRTMVTAAALALLALAAGIVGTTWGLIDARSARAAEARRADAERAAKEAEQAANAVAQGRLAQLKHVTRILAGIFADANPRTAEKEGKALYELFGERLNSVTPLLDGEALRDPLTAAELQTWLASAHAGLGYPDRAVGLLEKARQTFEERLGPDHLDSLRAQSALGDCYIAVGKEEVGRPLLEATQKRMQAVLGPDHPETLATMGNLAIAYRKAGRLELALPLEEQVLARRRATLGEKHPDTLNAMQNLAVALRVAGRFDQALTMLQEAWNARKETLGANHPDTLRSAVNLGQTYGSLGKPELAAPILQDALAALTAKLGREHPDTLGCIGNLGLVYRQLKKYDLALPLFQEQHTLTKARLGANHSSTLTALNNLALGYLSLGRTADALPLLEEACRLRRSKLGADHPDSLSSMNNLAAVYADLGRLEEAIALQRQALDLCEKKLGRSHPTAILFMTNLADCLEKKGQHDAALPLLKEAAEGVQKLGFKHQNMGAILFAYIEGLERAGRFEEADGWWHKWLEVMKEYRGAQSPNYARQLSAYCDSLLKQEKWAAAEPHLRACLALRSKLEPDDWRTFAQQAKLGEALLRQKKYAEAEKELLAAFAGMKQREKQIAALDRPSLAGAAAALVRLYEETGQPDKAAKWKQEAAAKP